MLPVNSRNSRPYIIKKSRANLDHRESFGKVQFTEAIKTIREYSLRPFKPSYFYRVPDDGNVDQQRHQVLGRIPSGLIGSPAKKFFMSLEDLDQQIFGRPLRSGRLWLMVPHGFLLDGGLHLRRSNACS